jgi:hypothetical protein
MANSSPICPNSTTSSSPSPTPTPPTSWTPSGSKTASPQAPGHSPCFKALLVVARRKRIGHASLAIPLTETREPGSMVLIDCGRNEGYIERKLALLSDLVNRAAELGATQLGWG